ncbi:hypothetical protein Efla_003283 [Eimeria flavescens]
MPEERQAGEVTLPARSTSAERSPRFCRSSSWVLNDRHQAPGVSGCWQVGLQHDAEQSADADREASRLFQGAAQSPEESMGFADSGYNDCGIHVGYPSSPQHLSDGEGDLALSRLHHQKVFCRCLRGSKASRRGSSSDGSTVDNLCASERLRLFCTAGVHGLPLRNLSVRLASRSVCKSSHEQVEQQPSRQTCADAPCDARAGEASNSASRCNLCGTLRAKPPSGFCVMPGGLSCNSPTRGPTGGQSPDGEGFSAQLGRLPSCDDCGCLLSFSTRKGFGPYHLLKQQQPQQKPSGEVVAGGVQWDHPTSFWLVESERGEAIEREFRRLFRLNSPESRIALASCRLLTTLAVLLAAFKYGLSTYFPPANQAAFLCFFCADVLIWSFFSCEVTLRARAMGLKRFSRDRQAWFDTFLQLVGLAALCVRSCILLNIGGLGTRIFDSNPAERTDGIVNDFTIGEVQHIALVALDTIQLARIYRLAFSCRELFFLTRSILHSLRSLLWTALFVLAVIYTCAIFCTWSFYDEEDAEMRLLWGNLVLSMFTLFTVLTLEGWNNVATATAEKHPFSRIFFVAYVCFTTLTLLNIVTGIILDAYVDMSSRLLKEANYKDDLEKDLHNEKVLFRAFEKTSFLVCMRPAVPSALAAQGTAQFSSISDPALETWSWGSQLFNGCAADASQENPNVTHPRESEPATTWRHTAASTGAVGAAANPSQSPRAPVVVGGARFERKFTGVLSEDSTARPSTESATDTEPLQSRTQVADQLQQDNTSFRTCVKYLRIGGHQPMDILRHPIVQDALQVARIPFYQAFDVLSMYHRRGIQFVTVKEFAEACGRVGGAATGRQLLQVQLELQQKLCAVERNLRILCRQKSPRQIYSATSKRESS